MLNVGRERTSHSILKRIVDVRVPSNAASENVSDKWNIFPASLR